jgi:hypothetical protein
MPVDDRSLIDQGHDAHFVLAVRGQDRVGFSDRLDELAPLLGVKLAELLCKEADVLRVYYTRSPSIIYYVKNFNLFPELNYLLFTVLDYVRFAKNLQAVSSKTSFLS